MWSASGGAPLSAVFVTLLCLDNAAAFGPAAPHCAAFALPTPAFGMHMLKDSAPIALHLAVRCGVKSTFIVPMARQLQHAHIAVRQAVPSAGFLSVRMQRWGREDGGGGGYNSGGRDGGGGYNSGGGGGGYNTGDGRPGGYGSASRDFRGRGLGDSWGGGGRGGGRFAEPRRSDARVTDEARNDRRKPWERGDDGTMKIAVDDDVILELLTLREQAKRRKEFDEADRLRNTLFEDYMVHVDDRCI